MGGRAALNYWLESLLADGPQGTATAAADDLALYEQFAHSYRLLSVSILPRLVSRGMKTSSFVSCVIP
jgi:hypothetical protein